MVRDQPPLAYAWFPEIVFQKIKKTYMFCMYVCFCVCPDPCEQMYYAKNDQYVITESCILSTVYRACILTSATVSIVLRQHIHARLKYGWM